MECLTKRCFEVYVAPGARGERASLGLTGSRCLLEDVPVIGWGSFSTTQNLTLPDHSHDGYEILYLIRGGSERRIGTTTYQLTPGDLYITRPGERHGLVDPVMTTSEYYWFQLEPSRKSSFPGLSMRDMHSVVLDPDAIEYRCFPASKNVAGYLYRILAEHKSPDRFSAKLAGAVLYEMLVQTVRDHAMHSRRMQLGHRLRSSMIEESMSLIAQHLDQPLSVLKNMGGGRMFNNSFSSMFLASVGCTPVEYRTRCRIQAAKAMLRENRLSILDIALTLGFGSSQYFATAFKAATGTSPNTYRQQILHQSMDKASDLNAGSAGSGSITAASSFAISHKPTRK